MDIVSPETRTRMMAGIKGKDTKPEMLVRRALFAKGHRFRLHFKDLPGAPDVVLPNKKVAIFVHGCFWHQHKKCRIAKLPASNADFWREKLDANVVRDQKAVDALLAAGWRVLIIWECATRNSFTASVLGHKISEWIAGSETLSEMPRADPADM